MGSHSVTCHPAEVTFPPLPPAEAGTRLSDPGGMQGWVDLVLPFRWLTQQSSALSSVIVVDCRYKSDEKSLMYFFVLNTFYINSSHHLNRSVTISVPVAMASPSLPYPQSSCAKTFCTVCCTMIYILMSRLVSYFLLTLLFTLCACFVDYAFVIVVIKESYYYY